MRVVIGMTHFAYVENKVTVIEKAVAKEWVASEVEERTVWEAEVPKIEPNRFEYIDLGGRIGTIWHDDGAYHVSLHGNSTGTNAKYAITPIVATRLFT